MIEPRIEFGIVAFVLHHSAGMRDRGPVAREDDPDFRQAEPQHDMGEIHGHLACEGCTRRTPRRGTELAQGHAKQGLADAKDAVDDAVDRLTD